MTFILFQRGATGWGFQIGRLYWQVNYPRFIFHRRGTLGHWGVEELPPGHPRRWMDFIPQAREDQKRTDYPGCARGIMNCRSTVCGCVNESRSNPAFVIARAKLLAEEEMRP